ncbi:MAG: four helix bundle protein [Bacteroidetes bacterium]|nr:four helix bundle protein [Bacteroidota bacterium]
MLNFKKMKVWEASFELVEMIYNTSLKLPREEIYGISDQIKRASVSISSNIAEGCSRLSDKDKARFIEMALGSAFELETQILICKRLEYFNNEESESLLSKISLVQKLLSGFIYSLRNVKTIA